MREGISELERDRGRCRKGEDRRWLTIAIWGKKNDE